MSERLGPIYSRDAYAGFLRRTAALVIDGIILLGFWAAAPELWYAAAPAEWVTEASYAWLHYFLLIADLAYLLGMRLTEKGTVGYRIVGIRYAYVFSGKPILTMLAYRAVLALFLTWFFALNHIWILFDERKQAWHDKVSGFYVVKRNAKPIGTGQVVRRVIEFMMLTFEVWEPKRSGDQPQITSPAAEHTEIQ